MDVLEMWEGRCRGGGYEGGKRGFIQMRGSIEWGLRFAGCVGSLLVIGSRLKCRMGLDRSSAAGDEIRLDYSFMALETYRHLQQV
jgi:hypothetical protein